MKQRVVHIIEEEFFKVMTRPMRGYLLQGEYAREVGEGRRVVGIDDGEDGANRGCGEEVGEETKYSFQNLLARGVS